jgi:hypothetical protein
MKKALFYTCTLTLMLAGCASSGPTIMVNSAPGSDLASFETFNFMQPLGTDRSGGFRTPMSTMLINSLSQEMASRGLKQSDSPDLLVDFLITTEDRMDVRTTPTGMHSMHRSHWSRGCCTTWPTYQTTVRQYTQGTLLIDLIDPAANALIAEGAAQRRLRNTDITQQQTDELVGQIMAELLPR